jgi:PAS domain S-box-containing protein
LRVAERTAELTRLNQTLAKNEERFRRVVEAAPNAIVMIGAGGQIEMVNTQAERMFDYPRAELLGQPVEMLLPARFRAQHPGLRSGFFAQPQSRAMGAGRDLFGLRRDGSEFQVEIGLNPIETEEGAMVLSAIVDISARVQLEAQLRQALKMEAVGRLTAGVAHDFNNLLQALMGGLELLLDEVDDRPAALEYGRIAYAAAERGGQLTHRLLAFSRQQTLLPRVIPVRQLLEDVEGLIARTFEPNITLRIAPVPGGLAAFADAAQLEAAIINLAVNARDAMKGGGQLVISAFEAAATAAMGLAAGRYAVLAVEDTGHGMDAATLAQACEPFFTTKGLDGSGLGLSMVQGFARQSGGDVQIQSSVGRGTRIEIWLPVAAPPEKMAEKLVQRQQYRGRILLVDDAPDVLVTVGAFLLNAGFEVTRVATGDEALARLLSGERFDAIITDYAMPGLNGIDLLLQAREIDAMLPGMIITGFSNPDLRLELDEVVILRKPFKRAELLERVHDIINSTRQLRG